jgi:hypothetical protein
MSHDPFLISTPRDMLEKAKREFTRLQAEMNADNVFNFFVTTYHVMDYVKNLGTVDQHAIDAMYADTDFDLCRIICTLGKHLEVRIRPKKLESRLMGGAELGSMELGEAELGSVAEWRFWCDGSEIDPVSLGCRLLEKWEQLFRDNGIS